MTVQACMLVSKAIADAAVALNAQSFAIGGFGLEPRQVDNPIANTMVGLGDITGNVVGLYYVSARLLVDPLYTTFYHLFQGLPIYHVEGDLLYLPGEEV